MTANHRQTESIWLVTYKKDSGHAHVPYSDIVEEALCFGWVDSRPAKLDDKRSMLLLSPRRTGSGWSLLNKTRVARLIAAGAMASAGLAKIAAAKADGTWSALDTVSALTVPDDLAVLLSKNKQAAGYFQAFPPSARRGILEWIANAKRPETRARRIAETVTLAANDIRANHPTPRKGGKAGGGGR